MPLFPPVGPHKPLRTPRNVIFLKVTAFFNLKYGHTVDLYLFSINVYIIMLEYFGEKVRMLNETAGIRKYFYYTCFLGK